MVKRKKGCMLHAKYFPEGAVRQENGLRYDSDAARFVFPQENWHPFFHNQQIPICNLTRMSSWQTCPNWLVSQVKMGISHSVNKIWFLISRPTKERMEIVQSAVQLCYRQFFSVSPKQTIHIADNYKGYKLLSYAGFFLGFCHRHKKKESLINFMKALSLPAFSQSEHDMVFSYNQRDSWVSWNSGSHSYTNWWST